MQLRKGAPDGGHVCERQTSFSELPPGQLQVPTSPTVWVSQGGNQEAALSVMSSEVCRLPCSVTERKQTVFNCLFDKYD